MTLVPYAAPTMASTVAIGRPMPTHAGISPARRTATPRATLPTTQVRMASGAAVSNHGPSPPSIRIVQMTAHWAPAPVAAMIVAMRLSRPSAPRWWACSASRPGIVSASAAAKTANNA
ncbi:MAG: hypothetical protein H0U33_10200 [Solirubrobacterales bacterium]|nr:hypothetical protein [Solirubrobacterales bacterium]